MDWELWQVVKHFGIQNPNEVLQNWSLEQLFEAHAVIDLDDALEAKAAKAQEMAAKNASYGKVDPPEGAA